MTLQRFAGSFVLFSVLLAGSIAFAGGKNDKDDDDHKDKHPKGFDFSPEMAPPAIAPAPRVGRAFKGMGATPGGAKDIEYARDRILAGEVPHANTFTPEGLFSQYDLPLPSTRACNQILCLSAAAAKADLIAQPEVRHLAQLGFASNLDPKTWRRAPLNLVAVVDKSGSMSGQPLDTVKASLRQVASQMTGGDQLAIVLYGDTSHVHLAPTSLKERERVLRAIDAIQSAGSTAMEEGLRVGFDTAFRSKPGFSGTTRVMLFTDERPNVGATDKDSFMGMAREASRRGVGMTTVGVGVQFGAELATAIGSVRGGNLVFFADVPEMTKRFTRDFDTFVTELAYDMELTVRPTKGFRLVGLYGVPGDLVKRTPDGGLSMTIETIFLSRDKGGIYFAFAPASDGSLPANAGVLGEASLHYTDTQQRKQSDRLSFPVLAPGTLPLGLARGLLLVDEITTLKQASALHGQQNKTEEAYRLVRALKKKFFESRVSGLDKEKKLIEKFDATLTLLSGHRGEPARVSRRDVLTGMPAE
jgi:Ca-activated chloride channel family protein